MAEQNTPLGRLTPVAAREVWPDEARDFTPWLLQNVDVLSDLLGMDLVLEQAEHPVGDFRLDLKGYDEATNEVVIVENQLTVSDHTHLGQIITYAAGTNPSTIVWIAPRFREEHRAAIDWLNERTDENTRVFGVIIKVVRIGDSEPAPAFELAAQPNDWEKQVRTVTAASTSQGSAKTLLYRGFWEAALEKIREQYPQWTRARTTNASWCNSTIGVSGVIISMAFRKDGITASIYFEDRNADVNQSRFDSLYTRREAFENALGEIPNWDDMPGRKAARVVVASSTPMDVSQTDNWPAIVDWFIDAQIRLRVALDAVGGIQVDPLD